MVGREPGLEGITWIPDTFPDFPEFFSSGQESRYIRRNILTTEPVFLLLSFLFLLFLFVGWALKPT